MLECFLLLRQSGARWIPLLVIPAVLAGGLASICLMLSLASKASLPSGTARNAELVALQVQSGLLGGFAPSGHRRRQQ